jgi:hypothetical protein
VVVNSARPLENISSKLVPVALGMESDEVDREFSQQTNWQASIIINR